MLKATLKKYQRPMKTHTLDLSHSVFSPSSATAAAPPFFSTRAEVGRAAAAAVPPRVWRRMFREQEGREAGREAVRLVCALMAGRKEEEGGRAKKESAVTARRRVERTRR